MQSGRLHTVHTSSTKQDTSMDTSVRPAQECKALQQEESTVAQSYAGDSVDEMGSVGHTPGSGV